MYAHDRALLDRILAFDIDGRAASLSFERRLARESGWNVAFARRVVAEYRRFLYLAMTAGHAVTPSDEVDQAWHLHMVYTESYWTRLCGSVLPRPLHHNPTASGKAEDAKFVDWYQRTIETYRAAFGEEPPADIWPASAERFDPKRQFQRIRTQENWIVPKRAVRNLAIGAGGVGALSLALGTSYSHAESSGAGGLVCGAIGLLLLAGVFSAVRRQSGFSKDRRNSSSGCGGSSCGSSTPFLFGGHANSRDDRGGHQHGNHGHGHGHDQSSDAQDAGGSGDGGSSDGGGSGDGGSSGCGGGGCGGGGD